MTFQKTMVKILGCMTLSTWFSTEIILKVFCVLSPDFNFYHSVLRYQYGFNTNISEESASDIFYT